MKKAKQDTITKEEQGFMIKIYLSLYETFNKISKYFYQKYINEKMKNK